VVDFLPFRDVPREDDLVGDAQLYRQVLEIGNLAPFPLVLKPGVRICQIILERTEGGALYQGRFMDQDRL